MVTILTDANAAFIFSAILSVFVGVFSGNVYMAAFTLMSSAGAIYHLQNCRDRTALVAAGLWIGAINAATALALDLLGANEPSLRVLLFDSFCGYVRSEEHTSELQSRGHLVCRLLLEKKK